MIANRGNSVRGWSLLETTIRAEINPAARGLAQRLVAMEKEARAGAAEDSLSACRVCEKLRLPLSQLVGRAGFRSLLLRAVTLAQRESPALGGVDVMTDGSIVGLEGVAAVGSVVVAHLIQLLMTFIGEGLTLALLLDIWPENGFDEPSEKDGHER